MSEDNSGDLVDPEVERAYRRGFNDGADATFNAFRDGVAILDVAFWLGRVAGWSGRPFAWTGERLVRKEYPPVAPPWIASSTREDRQDNH
jgi:hypothetical protein